jgi:hypothetical protein
VLAGDGEMRPEVEALIGSLGLRDAVRITGWIDSSRVREEILAARALVLPSFAEGLPVVIMEAMALRRPVISTFVAGIPELVRTGEDGWLVPAGDVDALQQAVEACLAAPEELLAGMGEAGRERVLARHSADVEAAKLAHLFVAGALGRARAGAAVMVDILGAAFTAAALLLLVPALVLVAQVLAAGAGAPAREIGARRPSLAVLMPAHDEAAGIAATIRALLPQLATNDRLVVVADNCGDDTAAVAAACGADVTVRVDATRRGKGYALDHGVRYLASSAPEVVVIVDADCIVADGALDALARVCADAGRPTQALYLMRAPPGAALGQRIAQFAWAVRNQVRPSGWHRLGWPCQLMGTGMAFPVAAHLDRGAGSGSIVEDMQLGIDLAALGAPPEFCPEALSRASSPTTSHGVLDAAHALGARPPAHDRHPKAAAAVARHREGQAGARRDGARSQRPAAGGPGPDAVALFVAAGLVALAGGSAMPLAVALVALA